MAVVAKQVMAEKMLAVIADSPSLARTELHDAEYFCKKHEIPYEVIETGELNNEKYLQNAGDRCYHCKQELFSKMDELATIWGQRNPERADWLMCYGANKDDLGDYRPGMQAAKEADIRAPLLEAGLGKEDVRQICRDLALEISEKEAMPCLASRIPHGMEVSSEKLAQIEKGEHFLRALGIQNCRLRHHGDLARIEVPEAAMSYILENREMIDQGLREFGFHFISMDLKAFKSGSLNVTLKEPKG